MGTFASRSIGLSDTFIGRWLRTDAPPLRVDAPPLANCALRPRTYVLRLRTYALRLLPEGGNENSPGWRPRQRTEPWERIPNTSSASRRAARILSPNILRVVVDAMLLQESEKLRLEIAVPMMLLVPCDIRQCSDHLRPPNRKRSIPFLPLERWNFAHFAHPAGRSALNLPHCPGHRQGRWHRQKQVHVVIHPAHAKCLDLVFARNAAHILPQSRLEFGCNDFALLLGRKNTMKQRTTVGV